MAIFCLRNDVDDFNPAGPDYYIFVTNGVQH